MVNDKRTRHTEERIQSAMLICLKDSAPEKVTVKQLCEIAGINRSTFYAHYQNPVALYALLEKRMTTKINRHFEELHGTDLTYIGFLKNLVSCYYDNKELFLALYKTDSVSFKNKVFDLLKHHGFLPQTIPDDVQSYYYEFYISGFFGVITRWLSEGPVKSVDEIAETIYRLTRIR